MAYLDMYGTGGGAPSAPSSTTKAAKPAKAGPQVPSQQPAFQNQNKKHFYRSAGGTVWEDPTLADWNTNDFRIFVGDIGPELTDAELLDAFASRYKSTTQARVVKDKRTGKSKGYGFVALSDAEEYRLAMREMNGKYIGSRPVKLKKSEWKQRDVSSRTIKKLYKGENPVV